MSDIIQRIEREIEEFTRNTVDEPKVLRLGFKDARRLYAWAMNNVVFRWSIDSQSEVLKRTPEEFLQGWEYRGMRIEVTSEPDGIEIAP